MRKKKLPQKYKKLLSLSSFGIIVVLIILLTSGSSVAKEPDSSVVAAFIGLGASTCAEFAEMYRASPAQTERAFYSWAQGYMSGMNDNLILLKLPPIKNLNSIPNDEKQSFLRTYCDSHPLNFYASAVTQLYISLKDAPITEDNGKKQTMPAMQK